MDWLFSIMILFKWGWQKTKISFNSVYNEKELSCGGGGESSQVLNENGNKKVGLYPFMLT